MNIEKKWLVLSAVGIAFVTFILTVLIMVTPVGKMLYFSVSDTITDSNYSKLYRIEKIIESNFYEDVSEEKRATMNDYALAGYVAGLGDVYTNYMTKDQYEAIKADMEDTAYSGIGIEISTSEEKIKITSVMGGSPAGKAGIIAGDYIVAVNGKKYLSDKANEAISKIKSAPEGTKVMITVERNGETIDLEVKTEHIEIKNVTYKMIDSSIGYIRIKTFGEKVGTEFIEASKALEKQGMKSLVIDLRSNPGGSLDSVVEALDYLLPEGVITTIKYKNRSDEVFRSDDECLDIPMCVLINESSASASEIMAGALKDYNKATLIGNKTYGKGVVQGIYGFNDGSAVKVTVAKYYTPSDVCIDKIGIKPDIKVDLPEGMSIGNFDTDFKNDTQFEKAIEILSK